jgi:hypothetical protein
MAEIMNGTSIGAAFAAAVSAHADRPFLAVPTNEGRTYLPSGFEMSYGEAGKRIEGLAAIYRQAGYGMGHRVATLLVRYSRRPAAAKIKSAICLGCEISER